MGKKFSEAKNVLLLHTEFSIFEAVSMRLNGSKKKIYSFTIDGAVLM